VSLEVLGFLPHRRAMEIAGGASAGLSLLHDLPNYADSLPTKVIEYLEMGLPVVASDLPGTRAAVAGRGGVALVPPGDPAAAAGALDAILAGGEARRAAAAQAPSLRESLVWPDDEVRRVYGTAAGVMRN
jgi:glycosyltransferase involved in cell wall biosynthesis